jgi:hypothetical protein
VESIKTIYWTLSTMGDGPHATAPVDEAAQQLIRRTADEVVQQLISRSLVLTNLSTTLALAQSSNPLRPLRYLMNCMLKVWETRLSDAVRRLPVRSCQIFVIYCGRKLAFHLSRYYLSCCMLTASVRPENGLALPFFSYVSSDSQLSRTTTRCSRPFYRSTRRL